MPPQPIYVFPPFRLVHDERSLVAGDQPLKLGSRAFDLLLALIERRDRTVSKNELLEVVWPHAVVEENNLQVQVNALRKLLGHHAITTVPGRGYRFTLPVKEDGGERPASGSLKSAPATAAEPAIAAIATAELPRSNLPSQLADLYGREAEVEAVGSLLRTRRLVTIAGAGGIGKTRVAQAAAHAARAEFADGVWWVDLAAIADHSLVPMAVARALSMSLADDRDAVMAVVSNIDKKRLLLVLDNCEHLLDGVCMFVDAVIAAAPNASLLVTSQEVLKTPEEHVYRLGTLALAPRPDVQAVAASGAGALFCARVGSVLPGFALTSDNASAVADICRQLDGIPLALELAAARVPLLGVDGVRARLSERFRVLTAGARAVLRRHQTLRAALEWSHGLLSDAERAVFRRLGVFVGGFTLESAQRVADDEEGIDAWDVLEHLGALVDKSLVLAEGEPVPRYRMLETTRLFALEQLALAEETAMAMRKHAEAVTTLLSALDAPQKRWRTLAADWAAAAVELDNTRAALEWAQRLPQLDVTSLDLASASLYAFTFADATGEAFRRLLAWAPRVGPELPADARARFWLALARLGIFMARLESFDAARRAAELFAGLGDDQRRYTALGCATAISARCDTGADGDAFIAEAASLERDDWPPRLLASFQWARHRWLLRQGRPEQALPHALRQVELTVASGALRGSHNLDGSNVAYCELAMGNAVAAEDRGRRALAEGSGGSDIGFGDALETLAMALAAQGRFDEALAVARRSYGVLKALGIEFMLLDNLALIAAEQGRLHDAALTAGHADAEMQKRKFLRWPLSEQSRQRAEQLLEALPKSEADALKLRGAALAPERAFAHALGDVPPMHERMDTGTDV